MNITQLFIYQSTLYVISDEVGRGDVSMIVTNNVRSNDVRHERLSDSTKITKWLNFGQKKPPINGGTTNPRNQRISCFSSLPLQDSISPILFNS